MGYFVGIPLGGAAEKDCQVRFGKNMTFQVETRAPHLPAEWALQSVDSGSGPDDDRQA